MGAGDEASIVTGKTTNRPRGPVGMCKREKNVLLTFVNIFSFLGWKYLSLQFAINSYR